MEAVSKQDYTDALAQARQADAAVAQNAAALRAAQVNVRFTRVPAPISGRIGLSSFTEGALVTANQAEPLATITRLDPVYVDIQESAADLLALRQALSQGGAVPTTAQVRLKLPDGSDYGFTGTVEFSEVLVDQATGTVTLRARFPNPQSVLLPGMFVTARFAQAVDTSAFLVPQPAISRDPKGNATLFVVGPGQPRGPARRRRRPHAGAILGRDPGPRAGRKGHHPGHRQSQGRRADQAGSGGLAAARQGAAARAAQEDERPAARRLAPCRGSSSIARSSPG